MSFRYHLWTISEGALRGDIEPQAVCSWRWAHLQHSQRHAKDLLAVCVVESRGPGSAPTLSTRNKARATLDKSIISLQPLCHWAATP